MPAKRIVTGPEGRRGARAHDDDRRGISIFRDGHAPTMQDCEADRVEKLRRHTLKLHRSRPIRVTSRVDGQAAAGKIADKGRVRHAGDITHGIEYGAIGFAQPSVIVAGRRVIDVCDRDAGWIEPFVLRHVSERAPCDECSKEDQRGHHGQLRQDETRVTVSRGLRCAPGPSGR